MWPAAEAICVWPNTWPSHVARSSGNPALCTAFPFVVIRLVLRNVNQKMEVVRARLFLSQFCYSRFTMMWQQNYDMTEGTLIRIHIPRAVIWNLRLHKTPWSHIQRMQRNVILPAQSRRMVEENMLTLTVWHLQPPWVGRWCQNHSLEMQVTEAKWPSTARISCRTVC